MSKKIILYVNPDRDVGFKVSGKVADMLTSMGFEYETCEYPDQLHKIAEKASMVITFGGDGTLLHCARAISGFGIPILGINLGNKGFIAELESNELELVYMAIKGHYTLQSRMMLDVSVIRDGKPIYTDFALNDVVVSGLARVIEIDLFGDGRNIMTFSGDGLIISTPTGSTAYSMAAGGPIVEPDAENIIITPICPHALWAKPYVLAPQRVVTVDMNRLGEKHAYLSADGNDSFRLVSGDVVLVRKSGLTTSLVRLTDKSFYEKVSEKLGEKQ